MSIRRQNIAIGGFIVGAVVLAVLFLIYFQDADFGGGEKVLMAFDGSVKGLAPGAPVALRGAQVGQVTAINLSLDRDTMDILMLVEAELRLDRIATPGEAPAKLLADLVEQGLRATLNSQSLLTGLLYVQLDFTSAREAYLADIETDRIQIPTVPNRLERLTQDLGAIEFDTLVADIQRLVRGLDAWVASEAFQALPREMNTTLASVRALSEDLHALTASSGPELHRALRSAAVAFEAGGDAIPELSTSLQEDLAALRSAAKGFEETMARLRELAAPDSPAVYNLNRTLMELSEAARALKLLARDIEERPEMLLRGRREDDR